MQDIGPTLGAGIFRVFIAATVASQCIAILVLVRVYRAAVSHPILADEYACPLDTLTCVA